MLKSELIIKMTQQLPHLKDSDIGLALDSLLGQMTEALVQGERIEIRGFGSFTIRHRPPRIARNPKTGEAVALATKTTTHFKPGKEMRDRVNDVSQPIR